MKRIIVPIDFSSYAENAFLSAVEIAARGEASITCVNVITSDLDWKNLPPKEREKHQEVMDLESEAKEKLEAFVLDHHVKSNPVETIVAIGIPAEVIIELANKQMADLIVIGAYGKGYQEGRFIGSNLQKVIRTASCPVLAVKKILMGSDLKNMAYACLFNEVSKPSFVRMSPLIRYVGATVHFLYINVPSSVNYKDSGKAELQMDKYAVGFEDLSIFKHVYEFEEAEKGIIDFCKKNDIGWIGIATNTRKSVSSYQIGVTETVIFKSDLPVLSVKFT